MWGSGVLEVRGSGVFREVLGGQEAWKSRCLNSRIVTIIFETENLFFSAREGYSAIHYGIRRRGERGLRFLPMPPLPSPCRGHCIRLKRRVRAVLGPARVPGCPGGWRRASGEWLQTGLYPFQPAAASGRGTAAAPLCPGNRIPAAVTSMLKRFPPSPPAYSLCRPCPQVPAGLHAPASCGATGPAGSPGPRGGLSRRCGISAAAEGAGLPPAAGRCSPGHGPAADAHALGTARMAWTGGLSERGPGVGAVVSPAGDHPFHRRGRRPPASCRLPRPRRGGGDSVRKPK